MYSSVPCDAWVRRGIAVGSTVVVLIFGAVASTWGGAADAGGANAKDSSQNQGAAGGGAGSQDAKGASGDKKSDGYSIESELLIYRSLDAEADAIVKRLFEAIKSGDSVVIANDADASGFLEWRAVMGQAQLLHAVVKDVGDEIGKLGAFPRPTPTPTSTPRFQPYPALIEMGATEATPTPAASALVGAVSAAFPEVQAVVGIVTAIAGMFKETESMGSVRGTVQDLPLVNAVAGKLIAAPKAPPVTVYVPNSYAPGLFARSDLQDTLLLPRLDSLLRDRSALQEQIKNVSGSLQEAAAVAKDQEASPLEKDDAQQFIAAAAPALARAVAARTSIDAYMARLVGAPLAARKDEASSAGDGEKDTTDGSEHTPKPGAKRKATTTPKPTATPKPDADPAAAGEAGQGIPLAKLLRADLLAQRIFQIGQARPTPRSGEPERPSSEMRPITDDQLKTWHVLVLKALESAGTVMVKDSFFRTAYSYSGGAITTYALYALADGHMERGGIAYGYEGFIREKHLVDRMHSTDWLVLGPPSLVPPTPTPTPSR